MRKMERLNEISPPLLPKLSHFKQADDDDDDDDNFIKVSKL